MISRMVAPAISALLFLQLSSAAVPGAGLDTLSALWESRRWFALRDALLPATRQPVFYQAAVACAFNDPGSCERKVNRFLKIGPKDAFPIAHNFLVAQYMRTGEFRKALQHREIILELEGKSDQPDASRTMMAGFSRYPQLSVVSRHASTVSGEFKNGHLFIPARINGQSAKYILDTGANLSTLTESEAKRLRLRSVDMNGNTEVSEATGKGLDQARFAIADDLVVGRIHLKNVPFVVVTDQPEAFSALPPGYRGAIGIQVLLACRTVAWNSDGMVSLGGVPQERNLGKANLSFNGLDTFTRIGFLNGKLEVQVDTGADSSTLFQRFANQYPEIVGAAGAPATKFIGGAGGEVEVPARILPELAFRLDGYDTTLKPAYITEKDVESDGTVGMDILRQAGHVAFDFRAMTLTLLK